MTNQMDWKHHLVLQLDSRFCIRHLALILDNILQPVPVATNQFLILDNMFDIEYRFLCEPTSWIGC